MSTSWRSAPLPPGWKRIRAAILDRDPICRWGLFPDEDGPCANPSTDCDHLGAPDDNSPGALRGLCHPHHERRSQAQRSAARWTPERSRRRPQQAHPAYKDPADDPGLKGSYNYGKTGSLGNGRKGSSPSG